MPSPFPGMDPFLEHPLLFPTLHDGLIFCLSEALQPRLPEPYYAVFGSQVWVETSGRYIEPDVDILRPPGAARHSHPGNGGVATISPVRIRSALVPLPEDERRRTFVEIYTRQNRQERLVTLMEVLSLTNKTPSQHGRDLYLRKQRDLLYSQTNLIEIDLLRGGLHSTAVPLDQLLQEAGPFAYHVCVHRFDKFEDFFVYPIPLEARLPEIEIPLLPDDAPVVVDLQAVFDRCYDAGPYRRRVRYAEEQIVPPLRPDQAEWAAQILRVKGLLPTSEGMP